MAAARQVAEVIVGQMLDQLAQTWVGAEEVFAYVGARLRPLAAGIHRRLSRSSSATSTTVDIAVRVGRIPLRLPR